MGDYLRTTPAAPSDPPRVWEPLYDQSALDAAVAAERERCAKIAEDMDYSPDLAISAAIRGA